MAKRHGKRRLTEDGLPVDPLAWAEDDWRTLHVHMEAVKREIRERHERDDEADQQDRKPEARS